MIGRIIEVLVIPIMILNMFGGVVAGIWLAFLREWELIIIGIILVFTAHWYLSILMLPGTLLGMLAVHLSQKKNLVGYFLGFLIQFQTNLLIVGTCALAFLVCRSFYSGESKIGLIPYLLWSWGMALGPWQFFQSKEPDNEFSAITLFSASTFYFLFLVGILLTPILVLIVTALFLLTQLFVLPIFNIIIAYKMQNSDF